MFVSHNLIVTQVFTESVAYDLSILNMCTRASRTAANASGGGAINKS